MWKLCTHPVDFVYFDRRQFVTSCCKLVSFYVKINRHMQTRELFFWKKHWFLGKTQFLFLKTLCEDNVLWSGQKENKSLCNSIFVCFEHRTLEMNVKWNVIHVVHKICYRVLDHTEIGSSHTLSNNSRRSKIWRLRKLKKFSILKIQDFLRENNFEFFLYQGLALSMYT